MICQCIKSTSSIINFIIHIFDNLLKPAIVNINIIIIKYIVFLKNNFKIIFEKTIYIIYTIYVKSIADFSRLSKKMIIKVVSKLVDKVNWTNLNHVMESNILEYHIIQDMILNIIK